MELPFSYTLIRARRKTVQLRVGPDGQVILRAPQAIRRAQATRSYCGTRTGFKPRSLASRHAKPAGAFCPKQSPLHCAPKRRPSCPHAQPTGPSGWAYARPAYASRRRPGAGAAVRPRTRSAIPSGSCYCPRRCRNISSFTSWRTSATRTTARHFTPREAAFCPTSAPGGRRCAPGRPNIRWADASYPKGLHTRAALVFQTI